MQFTKVPYAGNFVFARKFNHKEGNVAVGNRQLKVQIQSYEGDIHHLVISHPELWSQDENLVALNVPAASATGSLRVGSDFEISLLDSEGQTLLTTDLGFGTCGKQFMFCFQYDAIQRFYGMGEKSVGHIELSHMRSRFWNTDVLADFHYGQWEQGPADPYYVSIPYLIIETGGKFVGLLLHNPYPSWMDTGSDPSFFGTEEQNRKIIIGAEDGLPSLWLIVGPTLAELTRKLQNLVGKAPRPPLWALGYHQCRWDYEGERDLLELSNQMVKNQLPCTGLWLDIDYMEGYRVFSVSKSAFPNGVKKITDALARVHQRVVPILDPGVKLDPAFEVYASGLKADIFCKNPNGHAFVGFVWPGETVYPDFSLPEGRQWWAQYAKEFRQLGFGGAWLDMNDPATGAVDPESMLFGKGTRCHASFRNQYALGMQMATHEGFLNAAPEERPFLLSRSGTTGTSRYSAIWTGDNVSNRWYLKGCIPTSVGLSLSGVSFNGPDVGGFIGNTTDELMRDWTKAGFLFPFFRNHSVKGSKFQEPWRFRKETRRILKKYLDLRHRLTPYLYQCFLSQEGQGDAVLRPVEYEFPGGGLQNDQFMVGPSLLFCPFLEGSRGARLPGKGVWFDLRTGEWTKPGKVQLQEHPSEAPVFVRDGSIVACQGEGQEIHVFCEKAKGGATLVYDDGLSFDYRSGKENHVQISAERKGDKLLITTHQTVKLNTPTTFDLVIWSSATQVFVNGKRASLRKRKMTWTSDQALTGRVLRSS